MRSEFIQAPIAVILACCAVISFGCKSPTTSHGLHDESEFAKNREEVAAIHETIRDHPKRLSFAEVEAKLGPGTKAHSLAPARAYQWAYYDGVLTVWVDEQGLATGVYWSHYYAPLRTE